VMERDANRHSYKVIPEKERGRLVRGRRLTGRQARC
jgi:hypothetical protein